MENQPVRSTPLAAKADNEYSVKKLNNHNILGILPIMYSVSASPQQTRCSNPSEPYLRIKGLSWSDLNDHRPTRLQRFADGLLVSAFLILLMFFWLVLPELFAA